MLRCRYFDDQRVGASQVGVCVAWRVAGSQAVFDNGRSSNAGVLRPNLCQPVTIYCAFVVALAYRECARDPATAGRVRYRWLVPVKA